MIHTLIGAAIIGALVFGVGILLLPVVFVVLEFCAKIARLIDRTPNHIIIPCSFLIAMLIMGAAAYLNH